MLVHTRSRRSGSIATLSVVLLVPLLAALAFAIDVGYVTVVRSELQNTADAAALAGVQELLNPAAQWSVQSGQRDAIRTKAIADAKASAKKYALYNLAGNKAVALNDNDIVVGYVDQQGNFNSNPSSSVFPNSVQILSRRDAQANGPVPLFFAPVIGTKTSSPNAIARATMYAGTINSLNPNSKKNPRILPMTYDVDHWDNFLNTGQDPDGSTSTASDNTPQLLVYPSIKYRGNFGELSLDGEHAGSSEIKDWINYGMKPSDVTSLQAKKLIPLDQHDKTKWDWVGNPGMKASTIMEVNDYEGELFLLPLYKAKTPSSSNYEAGVGQGSKYYYQIVRFVPIKIMPTNKPNKEILAQPAGYVDPASVFDPSSIVPAGTGNTATSSFSLVRLSN